MDERQMTLARDWHGKSVLGWHFSEKLNGCRAFWDGKQFWTREGNIIRAPQWFTRGLPNIALDGEIQCGRDGDRGVRSFQVARVALRHGGRWFEEVSPDTATPIQYSVFDCPEAEGTWQQRMKSAARAVKSCATAFAIDFWPVKHYRDFVSYLQKLKPEGVMFRDPDCAEYQTGRSETLLRFKI